MSYIKQNEVPIGAIVFWPKETIPANYLYCDGSSLNRITFKLLFNVIGVTWGNVDGNTFNVPNLCGKFLRGGTLATTQTDSFTKHRHTIPSGTTIVQRVETGSTHANWIDAGSSYGGGSYFPFNAIWGEVAEDTTPVDYDLGSGNHAYTYSAETRPYNTAFVACIRYS